MPEVNIEAMNEHLAEISRHVSAGAIAALVLDAAGRHTSTAMNDVAGLLITHEAGMHAHVGGDAGHCGVRQLIPSERVAAG